MLPIIDEFGRLNDNFDFAIFLMGVIVGGIAIGILWLVHYLIGFTV